MRIFFIGAVELSYRALERLIALDAEVVGVFTQTNAGINADFCDLGVLCERHKIVIRRGEDVNDVATIDWIKALAPDIVFCLGWSHMLKRELLEIAPKGVVGFHPSALPKNRGRHPLTWALVLGLDETATSFFFMEEKADSGELISQHMIPITPNDDAMTLYQKVIEAALEQLEELLPLLEAGQVLRWKQDHRLSNTWRKRGLPDGKIDWRMSAESIHNLVRGLARPYIGAHFLRNTEVVRVWRCEVVPHRAKNIEPGKIVKKNNLTYTVKCGDGALILLEIDPPVEMKLGEYL
jgi:methionyl-tRNA formyltransferase